MPPKSFVNWISVPAKTSFWEDPINKTFSRYERLPVRSLDILENEVIELIAQTKGDTVIDNGASSFIALSTYIKEMGIPGIIKSLGHDLSAMLNENLTFEEAINDPGKTIMTRQRLKIIQDNLFKRLDAVVVI